MALYRRRRRFGMKRLVPSNLFGRALLILVLPMVLSQLFLAHIFYDRHWASVSRNMANSVVGDIAWIYQTYTQTRDYEETDTALIAAQQISSQLAITVKLDRNQKTVEDGRGRRLFAELYKGLAVRLHRPVEIRADDTEDEVYVSIPVADGVLIFRVGYKSLASPTTAGFILWMMGSSFLLIMIAIFFLRNQVKPIIALARAAEQLGLGQDVTGFKPRGASEVRRAGRAFMVMAERIRRHVQNRTEMLAGISHDLRTPLTRMKLELELATIDAVTRSAITADIDEMGRMIDEYLDFARGDAGELAEPMDLNLLLTDIAAVYRRSKRAVSYQPGLPVTLMLRPQAMRRALTNLVDNALRYGGEVAQLTLEQSATFVRIKVTDQGPGIPDGEQEAVFKPFTRLEPSRNVETGGVGLGLSIARAVAQSHGGDVTFENQRDEAGHVTGLEVTLRLPRAVQALT